MYTQKIVLIYFWPPVVCDRWWPCSWLCPAVGPKRLEMLLPWKHSPPSWRSATDQFAEMKNGREKKKKKKKKRKEREEESQDEEQWGGVEGRTGCRITLARISVCTYPICDTVLPRSKTECFSLRNLKVKRQQKKGDSLSNKQGGKYHKGTRTGMGQGEGQGEGWGDQIRSKRTKFETRSWPFRPTLVEKAIPKMILWHI